MVGRGGSTQCVSSCSQVCDWVVYVEGMSVFSFTSRQYCLSCSIETWFPTVGQQSVSKFVKGSNGLGWGSSLLLLGEVPGLADPFLSPFFSFCLRMGPSSPALPSSPPTWLCSNESLFFLSILLLVQSLFDDPVSLRCPPFGGAVSKCFLSFALFFLAAFPSAAEGLLEETDNTAH